jgi:hypothetical protein
MMRFEFANAGCVIGVMMRDENVGKPPAGLFMGCFNRRRFGRVDCRGGASLRIVQQNAEIVAQTTEQVGLRGHGNLT